MDMVIHENSVRIGTATIAKKIGRDHANLLKTINRHRILFNKLGDFSEKKLTSTGGRPCVEDLLNKAQCLLLFSLMRVLGKKDIASSVLLDLIKSFDNTEMNFKNILLAMNDFDTDDIPVRFIYAAMDDQSRLKIGISNDPKRRIAELNIGNLCQLQLVYVKEATSPRYQDETSIHNAAQEYHIRSEWYEAPAIGFLQ